MTTALLEQSIDRAYRANVVDGDPDSGEHRPVKGEIRGLLKGIVDLCKSTAVTSIAAAPPSSPAVGARHLVAASGTSGVFVGKENQIAEWDGAAWLFGVAVAGDEVYVASIADKRTFNGATWDVFTLTTGSQTLTVAQQTVVTAKLGIGTSNSAYIISTDILGTSGVVTQAAFDSLIASATSSGKAIYVPANAVHDMGSVTKVLTNSTIKIEGKGNFRRSGVTAAPILEFQGGSPVIENVLFEYNAASTPLSGACQPFLFNACNGARASGVRAIGKWYVAIESRDGIADVIEGCFASGAINRAFYHTALARQSVGVKFINNTAICYDLGTSTRLTFYGMNMNSFALAAASIIDPVYIGNTVIGAFAHGAGLSDIITNGVFSSNTVRDCNTNSPAILVQNNSAYNRRPNGLTIIGNAVQGGSLGIQVTAGDNITISSNTIRDCTGAAFHLTALKDGLVQGNNINMPAGGYLGYLLRQPSILDTVGGTSISVDCTDVLFEGNKSRQGGTSTTNGGYQNGSSQAVRAAVKNNTLNNCGFPTVGTFATNYNNDQPA